MSCRTEISGYNESLLEGRSPGIGELKPCAGGPVWTSGLRVARVASVAILLASADTRITSAGSRRRDELLLSPLWPVNMDRIESGALKGNENSKAVR